MLTKYIKEFEDRNVKLISISSDSVRLLKNLKEEYGLGMVIISDRGAKIASEYEVGWLAESVGKLKVKQAVPSKFLINKEGIIVWRYIGKDKTDRPFVKMIPVLIDRYFKNPQ